MSLADGVSFTAASSGTGNFVFGAARDSFRTPAQANADASLVDGGTYSYFAQNFISSPTQREWGRAVYTASTQTFARSPLGGINNGTDTGTARVNFSSPPIVSLTLLSEDVRQILTANTSFYVATTGSDSHPGTLAQPWATIDHALTAIAALDCGGFIVTIWLSDGTYPGALSYNIFVGCGGIALIGNEADNSRVIINDTLSGFTCWEAGTYGDVGGVCFRSITFSVTLGTFAICPFGPSSDLNFAIGDCVFDSTPSPGGTAISAIVPFTGCVVCAGQVFGPSSVNVFGFNTYVKGNWQSFMDTVIAPYSAFLWRGPINLVGTPNFSVGFLALRGQSAGLADTSDGWAPNVGTATGPQFFLQNGSTFNSGGNGLNILPGDLQSWKIDASSSYDNFAGPLPGINTQTGANYNLVLTDYLFTVEMNNAGANTVTIPADATVRFPVGSKIWVTQVGAGATTVQGAAGVTLDNGGVVGGQWKTVKIYKRAANEWVQTNA